MTGRVWKGLGVLLAIAAVALLEIPSLPTTSWAQGAAAGAPQSPVVRSGAGVLRMPADMAAFDAAYPNLPVATAPFLSTIDFAQYHVLKGVLPGP
jgi:hypothetical protein